MIEAFYAELQAVMNEVPKKDIMFLLGDWNAKIGNDAYSNWKGICGQYSNTETNERGYRLLEFAADNNLFVANTIGPHKPSRIITWHSPNGLIHNQLDYILVQKRFRSSVNINKTQCFPGADVGSDHDSNDEVQITTQENGEKTVLKITFRPAKAARQDHCTEV